MENSVLQRDLNTAPASSSLIADRTSPRLGSFSSGVGLVVVLHQRLLIDPSASMSLVPGIQAGSIMSSHWFLVLCREAAEKGCPPLRGLSVEVSWCWREACSLFLT